MPNYTWLNEDTDEVIQIQAKIVDRDVRPDLPGTWRRVIEASNLMTAAYPDGTKRKGFEDLKKASKLEVDRANHPKGSDEHKAMSKEIADRKKI